MTTKEKGRDSGKSATRTTTSPNLKDQSAAAQRKRAIEHLQASPQTTYNLRAIGVSHPAQRVRELIAMGYRITSHLVTAVDGDGYPHRGVAMYRLEPEEGASQ